ncbi:hypothetical protein BpHYR1_025205, partial [Brachionus plicatilis]
FRQNLNQISRIQSTQRAQRSSQQGFDQLSLLKSSQSDRSYSQLELNCNNRLKTYYEADDAMIEQDITKPVYNNNHSTAKAAVNEGSTNSADSIRPRVTEATVNQNLIVSTDSRRISAAEAVIEQDLTKSVDQNSSGTTKVDLEQPNQTVNMAWTDIVDSSRSGGTIATCKMFLTNIPYLCLPGATKAGVNQYLTIDSITTIAAEAMANQSTTNTSEETISENRNIYVDCMIDQNY